MKFVIVIERTHQGVEIQGDSKGNPFRSMSAAEKAMSSRMLWANEQKSYVLPIELLTQASTDRTEAL